MPKKDLGDFQTPPALVAKIIDLLNTKHREWRRVLEPTCGRGNFLAGLHRLHFTPIEIQGIEIQEDYVQQASQVAQSVQQRVVVHQGNIFTMNLRRDLHWQEDGPLLVIGNPPWVTNSALGMLASGNVPAKANIKNYRGLDAMTGASNFDIAEYIWMKLMRELVNQQPTFALLCKTSVARNVLQYAAHQKLPITNVTMHKIDAQKWFGAAVDACLFCLDGAVRDGNYEALVYDDLESRNPSSFLRVADNRLFTFTEIDHAMYSFDGRSPLEWRQGVKHDAANVVELTFAADGMLCNKQGEPVQVESAYIYPLLKSSNLGGTKNANLRRAVIVPQKGLGEDIKHFQTVAPQLWAYLASHQAAFAQRKSAIYRNQPPFAYFGLGAYSFAPYKVAVSGMYKIPKFRLIEPVDGKPVMLDDTCYFLPCTSLLQAAFITRLLNHPLCQDFLCAITFTDAKRPITKKLLQRIDLIALLHAIDEAAWRALMQDIVCQHGLHVEQMQHWSSLQDLEQLIVTGDNRPSHTVQLSFA